MIEAENNKYCNILNGLNNGELLELLELIPIDLRLESIKNDIIDMRDKISKVENILKIRKE